MDRRAFLAGAAALAGCRDEMSVIAVRLPPAATLNLSHGRPFTITGSGFGTKSRALAPLLRDKGTATLGTVDAQWDSHNGAGTGADIPFNMQLHASSFQPDGIAIGTPHPFVSAFYGGAHNITNFPWSVYLAKKIILPALPCVIYLLYWTRNDPGAQLGIGSPNDNNYKFFGYSTGPGIDGNSCFFAANAALAKPSNTTDLTFQSVFDDNPGVTLQNPDGNGHNEFWTQAQNPWNPSNGTGGWVLREIEMLVTANTGLAGGGYVTYRENNGLPVINYAGRTDGLTGTTRFVTIGDAYSRNYPSANNFCYITDAYIDVTAGSMPVGSHVARVLMQDAAGNVSPQDITSWGDAQVAGTCWKGACLSGPVSFLVTNEAGVTQTLTGYTLA